MAYSYFSWKARLWGRSCPCRHDQSYRTASAVLVKTPVPQIPNSGEPSPLGRRNIISWLTAHRADVGTVTMARSLKTVMAALVIALGLP